MAWLRRTLMRNRGLIAGLALAGLALAASGSLGPPRPRASWVEVIRPSPLPPGTDLWEVADFSPDGRLLFTADPAGARVRDLATGAVKELTPGEPKGRHRLIIPEFLAGGRFVLGKLTEPNPAGPFFHSRRIWEAATGREWARIPDVGDDWAFSNDAISADGSTYARPPRFERDPAAEPRGVGVWKAAWGGAVRSVPGVDPIALSGDGRFLAAGGPGSPMASLVVHDVDSGRRVAMIPIEPQDTARCLALSGDGKVLAENRMPGTILWDVATGEKLATLDTVAAPVRFGAGDLVLILGVMGSREAPGEAWDLAARPPRLLYRGTIWHASPDGRHLVTAGPSATGPGAIGGPIEFLGLPPGPDYGLSEGSEGLEANFSPDGGLVAAFEHFTERPPWQAYLRYLPRPLRPRIAPGREVRRISVLDARSRRTVATVAFPETSTGRPDYKLVDDGRTLAVRSVRTVEEGATEPEERVDLWDVPAQPPRWGFAGGGLAVALGVIFDVRARRRGMRP